MPPRQLNIPQIVACDVAEIIREAINWKAAGVDNVSNVWYKGFSCLHEPLAEQLTHIVNQLNDMSYFVMFGLTYLLPKITQKHYPSQYKPISFLPTLGKI